MVKGLAHVCFFVGDLEASIEFYGTKLGLTPAFEFRREDGTKFGQYFHAGRGTFVELFQGKAVEGDPQAGRPRHICLEVEDIKGTASELRRRGGEVTPVKMGTDGTWQAWLTDPDGNRIELHDYTAASKQRPFLG